MNTKIDTIDTEGMIKTEQTLDAVDILSHVTKSMDYLEDVAEDRISSIITILHAEIDRAIKTLEVTQ